MICETCGKRIEDEAYLILTGSEISTTHHARCYHSAILDEACKAITAAIKSQTLTLDWMVVEVIEAETEGLKRSR